MQSYLSSMADLSIQAAIATESDVNSITWRYERNGEREALAVKELKESDLSELRALVSSDTRLITRERDRSEFQKYARVFNGAIQSPACLVVRPTQTRDVSEIVKFSRRHGFSISVKSGGHGVSGCAIRGDIIIDMGEMNSIEIEPPARTGRMTSHKGIDYESLRVRDQKDKGTDTPQSDQRTNILGETARERGAYRTTPEAVTRADYISLPLPFNQAGMHSPYNQGKLGSPFDHYLLPRERNAGISGTTQQQQAFRLDSALTSKPNPSHQLGFGKSGIFSDINDKDGASTTPPYPSDSKGKGLASSSCEAPHVDQKDPFSYMDEHPPLSPMPPYPSGSKGKGLASSSHEAPPVNQKDPFSYMDESPSLSPGSLSTLSRNKPPSTTRDPFTFRDISTLPPINHAQAAPSHPEAQRLPFNFDLTTPNLASTSTLAQTYADSFVQRYHSSYYRDHRQAINQNYFGTHTPRSSSGLDPRAPWATRNFTFDPHSLSTLRTPATEVHVKDTQAFVIFGTGAQQKEIDLYTHSHPLSAVDMNKQRTAVPYHIPSATHPVGSASMLLAGFGFLSRLYGLSVDNLVEVEMVLADGSIVYVSKEENEDLWWAIRGAGPAFGIATRIIARAYPVPPVYAGSLVYNFRATTAPLLIQHVRDCVKYAPRELYVMVLMTAGPPGQGSIIAIQICFAGSREKGAEFHDTIRAWDNGEGCLMNDVGTKLYLMQTGSVERMLRADWGRRWFLRSDLITSLTDELIDKTVKKFVNVPGGGTWAFELAGGAVSDYDDSCIPASTRDAAWNVTALHQWDVEDEHPGCISTGIEWVEEVLKPVSAGGPLPSLIARHERPERVRGSYGENWERLQGLKRKYDPDMVFACDCWPWEK